MIMMNSRVNFGDNSDDINFHFSLEHNPFGSKKKGKTTLGLIDDFFFI